MCAPFGYLYFLFLNTRWGYPCLARVRQPVPPPPPSASPHLNLRGLVFNFINKKILLLFLFFCCGFFFSEEVFYRYRCNYSFSAYVLALTPSTQYANVFVFSNIQLYHDVIILFIFFRTPMNNVILSRTVMNHIPLYLFLYLKL